MTLTEFLTARIDEDAETAREAARAWHPSWVAKHSATAYGWRNSRAGENPAVPMVVTGDEHGSQMLMSPWDADTDAAIVEHVARHDPARVLAECEARRRIVRLHGNDWNPRGKCQVCDEVGPCDTLCALALPYVDHPDYDEAWRP
jgi:hypothetical protein